MTARPLRPFAPVTTELDDPFPPPTRAKSGTMRKASRFEAPPAELLQLFPVVPEPVEHIDSSGVRFRMELDWNDRAKV